MFTASRTLASPCSIRTQFDQSSKNIDHLITFDNHFVFSTLGNLRGWTFLTLLSNSFASSCRIRSTERIGFRFDLGLPLKTNILNGFPSESKVSLSSKLRLYTSCKDPTSSRIVYKKTQQTQILKFIISWMQHSNRSKNYKTTKPTNNLPENKEKN